MSIFNSLSYDVLTIIKYIYSSALLPILVIAATKLSNSENEKRKHEHSNYKRKPEEPHAMVSEIKRDEDDKAVNHQNNINFQDGQAPQTENRDAPVAQDRQAPDLEDEEDIQRCEAIPIAWLETDRNDNSNKLAVDMNPLFEMLQREVVADLPVTIVSVNGRMRTGKSFLLNQIIKYLKRSKNGIPWINQKLDTCFQWNAGLKAVTSGIKIWPEPFILEHKGRKFALILMDTQGVHDMNVSKDESLKLFALTMLISSLVIYNDTVATDDMFKTVYEFVDFTKCLESDTESDGVNRKKFSFGKLLMLFRDWHNKNEYPCGLYPQTDPKKPNLRDYLLDSMFLRERTHKQRKNIRDAFDDVLVYAMSGPGNCLPDNPKYKKPSNWDAEFRDSVVDFVENIFATEFLMGSTKRIYGNGISAKYYNNYIQRWVDGIKKNNHKISDMTPFEMHINQLFNPFREESTKVYKKEMNQFVSRQTKENRSIFDFFKTALARKPKDTRTALANHQEEVIMKIKNDIWTSKEYKTKQDECFQEWSNMVKVDLQTYAEILQKIEKIKRDEAFGFVTMTYGAAAATAGVALEGGAVASAITIEAAAAGSSWFTINTIATAAAALNSAPILLVGGTILVVGGTAYFICKLRLDSNDKK